MHLHHGWYEMYGLNFRKSVSGADERVGGEGFVWQGMLLIQDVKWQWGTRN